MTAWGVSWGFAWGGSWGGLAVGVTPVLGDPNGRANASGGRLSALGADRAPVDGAQRNMPGDPERGGNIAPMRAETSSENRIVGASAPRRRNISRSRWH